MIIEYDGIYCRSELLTYSLGTPLIIRPDFLQPAAGMRAPEIADIMIRFSGTVGGVSGTALGEDAAKLYENIRIVDDAEIVNASGACLRVLEQLEFGSGQVDPATVASGATNASYSYVLRITFEPKKALRPRDTRIPLEHFLNGGQFTIQTASAVPTGWNTVQSDQRVQVWVRVVDGRVRELKSRMEIKEQVMSQSEFRYPVFGSLRCAIITSKLTTTGYTSLATLTQFDSDTLKLPPTTDPFIFLDRYRRMSWALGTNDEFADGTPSAIALVNADYQQKIGCMPNVDNLHIRQNVTPVTQQRLLTVTIRNRTMRLAALVSGSLSEADLLAKIANQGVVVDGKPGGTPAVDYDPVLVRRLPIRFGGDE